ncbi:Ig-like domain-containing protein [Candidatus Roizmanbacteria bacterium]|nr:Ig-like domain-containing protein [Candidatus Roizmanbacteria bacterium]
MSKRNLFIGFTVILLFVFVYVFFYEASSIFRSRAETATVAFSVENSYMFVTPLQAQANGQERIRISVFILSNQGVGVSGKKVILRKNNSLTLSEVQPISDQSGKALFDVSAAKAGEYYLEVEVDNKKLPQVAHLSFR